MADIKMTNHKKLFDLFHHKVMGATDSEVNTGKPAPDIFLVAAARFPDKPKPNDVSLYFSTNFFKFYCIIFLVFGF